MSKSKIPPAFAGGGKGQSGYVGYGAADQGCTVFLFSRHDWRILADSFIGFKDCFAIGDFKLTHTDKMHLNRNMLFPVLAFGAVKDFIPCYQPIHKFRGQFLSVDAFADDGKQCPKVNIILFCIGKSLVRFGNCLHQYQVYAFLRQIFASGVAHFTFAFTVTPLYCRLTSFSRSLQTNLRIALDTTLFMESSICADGNSKDEVSSTASLQFHNIALFCNHRLYFRADREQFYISSRADGLKLNPRV